MVDCGVQGKRGLTFVRFRGSSAWDVKMLASRVGLLASLARRAGRGEAGLGLGLKQGEGLLRVPRHLGLPRAAVAAERGAQAKASFSSSNEAVSEDLLIDTLEVMRGFERSGLKREEADVLTRHVTKLILQTSNQFSAKFASQVSRLFPRSCPAAVARPFSFPCLSRIDSISSCALRKNTNFLVTFWARAAAQILYPDAPSPIRGCACARGGLIWRQCDHLSA